MVDCWWRDRLVRGLEAHYLNEVKIWLYVVAYPFER
jgi:hypothetical protein